MTLAAAEVLGDQVRAARLAAGLSQQAVADAIGTSQCEISRLECGRTNWTVRHLARLLDAIDAQLVVVGPFPPASSPAYLPRVTAPSEG